MKAIILIPFLMFIIYRVSKDDLIRHWGLGPYRLPMIAIITPLYPPLCGFILLCIIMFAVAYRLLGGVK